MGKNIIAQARGRGTPTYRSPSFKFKGAAKQDKYSKETKKGNVLDIIHCPGHTAPLADIQFDNGDKALMIANEGIRVGDEIMTGPESMIKSGNSCQLKNIPEGTLIFNIEKIPGDGGKFCRSSGTFSKVTAKFKEKVMIILPSKKEKSFSPECRATIGVVAGGGRKDKPFYKAGNRYHKMKARNKLYPRVSGVSMNAVDHPFGGSSSHHKGRPTVAPRDAPPGRKVGKIRPKRTGRKKR